VTPPGIDPGTVRLVEQCLNHYATPGSNYKKKITANSLKIFNAGRWKRNLEKWKMNLEKLKRNLEKFKH
jgi:hypothetical protein